MSMNPSYESKTTDLPLGEGVIWSLIAHLTLGIIVVLKSLFLPSAPERYIPSLKVDLVALPDLTPEERHNLSLKKSKSKTQSEKKEVKKKAASKGKQLIQQRKARKTKIKSALSRIKSITEVQEEAQTEDTTPDLIKGNFLSKGSSLSGEAKEKGEPTYFDQVLERVRAHWTLPIWLARQQLSAQAVIYLSPTGDLISIRFQKPSGSTQFDEAVKSSIRKSAPFPPPPTELAPMIQSGGILLGFPL